MRADLGDDGRGEVAQAEALPVEAVKPPGGRTKAGALLRSNDWSYYTILVVWLFVN